MKKRNKIMIAIASGIALVSGLAACGHHRSPEDRADYMVEKISSKMELTETQVDKLEVLKNELLSVRKSMLAERDNVHEEVNELLKQATFDQTRSLALIQERTDSINQKAPQVVTALAGFYDSLSLEQQAMLREKVEEHKAHRGHWRH